MATVKPLVSYPDGVEEIRSGDTISGGGGDGQWTRITLASDYTNTTGSVETLPSTTATIDRRKAYRVRGAARVFNASGGTLSLSLYLGREHNSTGVLLSVVGSNSNGTSAVAATTTNTVIVSAVVVASSMTVYLYYEGVIMGASDTTGTTTIKLQVYCTTIGGETVKGGAYYELQEIVSP